MSTRTFEPPAAGVDLYRLVGSSATAELAYRADGARFVRYQDRTPRGYRWGAWMEDSRPVTYTDFEGGETMLGASGSGWRLKTRGAKVRLPDTSAAPTLRGWVGVVSERRVRADGTARVRVAPTEVRGVVAVAEVGVDGEVKVTLEGRVAARHVAKARAVGREALRQLLDALGPAALSWMEERRRETLAAGDAWEPTPDHLPCSLESWQKVNVVVD